MNKGTVILLSVGIAGGAFALGTMTTNSSKSEETSAAVAPAKAGESDGIERFRVPLEGTGKGPATAKVNIVAFSDFQCPFCSRVVPTLEKIEKEYPNDVRVFFRHNPLPFHPKAPLAAEAAVAADQQGKFWQMHDKMFANQQNIERADLEKYAGEIGLDMTKFKQALDSGSGKGRVQQDVALATQIGVQGTPNFYLNGRNIQGAQPYEEFKKVIDEEIKNADKKLKSGTPIGQLYASFMAGAKTGPSAPAANAPNPNAPKPPAAGAEVYKVAVADAATKGGKQPKVTIIEFSDFQCPFCSRVNGTLDQLLKDYGNDISISFRNNPLPFHNNAMPAALVAEEARAEGKFWPMHDKLFASQQNLDRPTLEKLAGEVGLNMGKVKAALDQEKGKERIKKDMDDAANFGARGTPNFFINGRNPPRRAAHRAVQVSHRRGNEEGGRQDRLGHAARPGLRGPDQGRPRQGGGPRAAAAPGRAGREHALRRRPEGRALQGRQGRAGDDRAVLGLPVPVLQPRRADDREGHDRVQGQGPRRLA
jgi:protein-disulfide isomerase